MEKEKAAVTVSEEEEEGKEAVVAAGKGVCQWLQCRRKRRAERCSHSENIGGVLMHTRTYTLT